MNKRISLFFRSFIRKFNEESIFKESAALTFVTVLGFIPFVIFILFLLPELPFLKIETQIQELIISIFVPSSAEQISEYISNIINQKIPFNLFNFIILLITSYSLFKIINDSFDNILNVHELRKKGFLTNFVKFLGMTIFGGLSILLLLAAASIPVVSHFIEFPLLQRLSLYFTPFMLLFIIYTLGFSLIPTIKVNRRSIFLGSAVSAIVWIIFKSLFNWYIAHLTNIELIFGVLASVPIFLFWIYANWIIILSGVIIVSILERRHIRRKVLPEDRRRVRITFEKILSNNEYDKISSTVLEPENIREIMQDILSGDTGEDESLPASKPQHEKN